eukprot:TRINITY_DN50267_c0_g1_i1.p1 TRINITY_DN50267_c0_g1~~TRINITY_DN50267_c0_g1_i1.p1  ORF type:complete len:365 (+),score=130.60 TRINITY_DN50267_c0_g1_i1:84-1097(+)
MQQEAADALCRLAKLRRDGLLTEREFVVAALGLSRAPPPGPCLAEGGRHGGVAKGQATGLQLYVRSEDGATHAVEVDPEATVRDVKAELERVTRLTPREQTLWVSGERLSNNLDDTPLGDLGIGQEAMLQLTPCYAFVWDDARRDAHLEITPNSVTAPLDCPIKAGQREVLPCAVSANELQGTVRWELAVQGVPSRGAVQPGRLRRTAAADDDADPVAYVGVASGQFDPTHPDADGRFSGAVTWCNNGQVHQMLQSGRGPTLRTQLDSMRSARLAYGAGALVGFSFDTAQRVLTFWKNGECVHKIGPTSLYLDSYRAVCAAGAGASVGLMRTTTFED